MTATHPTDRELEDFLLGKLIAPDDLAMESHLAECDECRARAVQTPADDTLTELLAAARTLVEVQRSAAPTPTLDGSATPPAFAPTLAWDGSAAADQSKAPPALAQHPKYRVVRRLGSGGMGTVWLAEHLVMQRPVAVKVIRPDLLARSGATHRFLREVRAAARLHHPNIVTAFDAEPVGDSCLLVMEYVPGQTLGERLEAGPLPVDEACRAIRDAARGLAHAHAAGLVHRDVKPHNLIRAADGTTKVLDFGLAGVGAGDAIPATGDGLTEAGMVVGTPDYIAPEQINNPHAADARADIYGLGCTLYHLLAGRPPLPHGSVAEKLAAQRDHEPDPIPELPSGLTEVLAKMMAKRPEDRYQSAGDLIAALEPFSGIPVSDQAPPKRRRPPLGWLALAAGILLITAGAVIFKIERDNQIVQVEVDDPDIEVVMKRKGEIVLIRDAKTNQTWEFDTIKNQIGMVDQPEGLKLGLPDKEPFVLRRKGERVFTVKRLDTWASMLDSSRAAKMEDATRAAEAWLKLYDAGALAQTWVESAAIARRSTTRDDWIRLYREAAQKSGKPRSRSVSNRQYATKFKDVDGEYIVLSYETDFELGKGFTERIVLALDPDGHWRVASYGYTKHPAILADPNARPLTPGNFSLQGAEHGASHMAPQLRKTIHDQGFPQRIAYTPDGKALLITGRAYFGIYDLVAGMSVLRDNLGAAGFNTSLAVSADGRTAAIESYGDIHIYDLTDRKGVAKLPRRTEDNKVVRVSALTLTADGQTLAAVIGREIVYHDRATGRTEHTRPDDDSARVQTVHYSRDGRYLVVASHLETDKKTRISILDAKTRELVARRELPDLLQTIHLSVDGDRLFVSGTAEGKRALIVLRLPQCEEIEQDADLPPGIGAPIPSPDGKLLVTTHRDGDVQVWDRGKKRAIFTWTPHPNARPEFEPRAGQPALFFSTSVAFSTDGRTLATARGNEIKVWDLTAPAADKFGETDAPTSGKK